MNYALYLGIVPPPLAGRRTTYIDGKPPKASPAKEAARFNQAVTTGSERRKRILELVDELCEVDLDTLERDEKLPIVRKVIGHHLAILVAEGELIRIDQMALGTGRCVIWRRPLILMQKT